MLDLVGTNYVHIGFFENVNHKIGKLLGLSSVRKYMERFKLER